MRFPEVFAPFVEAAEFAGEGVDVFGVEDFEARGLADGLFAKDFDFGWGEERVGEGGAHSLREGLEGFLLFGSRRAEGGFAFQCHGGAVGAFLGPAAVHDGCFGFAAAVAYAVAGTVRGLGLSAAVTHGVGCGSGTWSWFG